MTHGRPPPPPPNPPSCFEWFVLCACTPQFQCMASSLPLSFWQQGRVREWKSSKLDTKHQQVKYKTKLTLEMVRAGLHCSFSISRQMLPLLFIFGWNTLVRNETWNHHITQICLQGLIQKRKKVDTCWLEIKKFENSLFLFGTPSKKFYWLQKEGTNCKIISVSTKSIDHHSINC